MSTYEERRAARERAEYERGYALAAKNNRLDAFRARLIEKEIRKKYSVSDELAILRQRDTKAEEFKAYNEFVEQVKANVQALLESL